MQKDRKRGCPQEIPNSWRNEYKRTRSMLHRGKIQGREHRRSTDPFCQGLMRGTSRRKCLQLDLWDLGGHRKGKSVRKGPEPVELPYRMGEEGIAAVSPQIDISANTRKLDCPLETENLPLDYSLLANRYFVPFVYSAPCSAPPMLKDCVVWGSSSGT